MRLALKILATIAITGVTVGFLTLLWAAELGLLNR